MIEKENSCANYNKLIEVWESAVNETHTFLKEDDYQLIKSKLTSYFNNVDLYIYKNEFGNILGFMGISMNKLEMLFIHSCSRNKGIGQLMVKFAVNNLKIRKVDVNEQNTLALGFYKHLNFIEIAYSKTDSEGKNYPIIHLQLF